MALKCKWQRVSLEIDTTALPLFPHVVEAAEMGLVPAATYGNRKAITAVSGLVELESVWSDICFDPQTSGGCYWLCPCQRRKSWLNPCTKPVFTRLSRLARW